MPIVSPIGRRRLGLCLAVLAPGLAAAGEARWPNRPVRLIVPYQAGGQSDTVARLLQPRVAEFLGQPVVVENRSGAGGTIAAGLVAQAPADGYTFVIDSAAFLIVPHAMRNLPFDHETAFVPVGVVVEQPYVLAVATGLPPRDLAGFLALARQREITFGSPGHGSVGHLAGALLAQRAGVRLEHVPYRGGAELARDLAAGAIPAAIMSTNSLDPLLQDGKAAPLALTSAERRGGPPGVPTIAESGFPGFDVPSWNTVFARAGTPAPVLARMAEALNHATSDPGFSAALQRIGSVTTRADPAAAAARLRQERMLIRDAIRDAGIVFQ
ncbi:Bug family tripartite tricarboxylate transporter substrate binding protein [Roseicella aerolata]|uniref:Tripartite tricarboxylate transporter substrate binding protein n=1 Tax=Roseicella aerolata TaxID=2883479 RepID=A0A9X1IEK6_9PROT|nr:tripartite tricarboxylate transporter substrate binding protein [Roseicella aerolata]MCB4822977.1 tripartite tricarboxylate transporter substrate binding protein [Roseicella aerolata]